MAPDELMGLIFLAGVLLLPIIMSVTIAVLVISLRAKDRKIEKLQKENQRLTNQPKFERHVQYERGYSPERRIQAPYIQSNDYGQHYPGSEQQQQYNE